MFNQSDLLEAERFVEVYQKAKWELSSEEALKIHKASMWLQRVVIEIQQQVKQQQMPRQESQKPEEKIPKPSIQSPKGKP